MPCNPDFPNLLLEIQTFVFSKLSLTQTNKFFSKRFPKVRILLIPCCYCTFSYNTSCKNHKMFEPVVKKICHFWWLCEHLKYFRSAVYFGMTFYSKDQDMQASNKTNYHYTACGLAFPCLIVSFINLIFLVL